MASPHIGAEIKAVPPFRDVSGRFTTATQAMLNSKRQMMRVQGRRYWELVQEEAPERTGEYKRNIRWRTFASGTAVGFRVTVPQPLTDWIVEGTKAHVIKPRGRGYPLRFFWERMGRVVHFYRVMHPGTKKNPFLGRAFRRWLPGSRRGLEQISRDFVRTLAGAGTRSLKL